MHAIPGGLDVETFEEGRQAAALEIVTGYEQALEALHPDDVERRQWYREMLCDARTIAGLPPVAIAD
jgi:hypothetical protein